MDAPNLDIIVAPDPRLRLRAQPVAQVEPDERALIDGMLSCMGSSEGIGLAATQVGSDKRIIVVDVQPLDAYEGAAAPAVLSGRFEMANPTITSYDGRAAWQEGCLSVPGFKDTVTRHATIVVSYLDREGQPRELRAGGLLAACIQHEIDHLDGLLFIDRLSPLKRDIILRKLRKFRKTGSMVVRAPQGAML